MGHEVICEQCGRSYTRADHLRRHIIRSHDKPAEKAFECTWENCKKAWGTKEELRKHIRSVHEKKFACGERIIDISDS